MKRWRFFECTGLSQVEPTSLRQLICLEHRRLSKSGFQPLKDCSTQVLSARQKEAQKSRGNNTTLHGFLFIPDNAENRMMSLLIFSSRPINHSSHVVKMIESQEWKVRPLNVVQSQHFTWSPSEKPKNQGLLISVFLSEGLCFEAAGTMGFHVTLHTYLRRNFNQVVISFSFYQTIIKCLKTLLEE